MGNLMDSRRRIIAAQPHLTTAQSWTNLYNGAIAHFNASAALPIQHCVVTIPGGTTGRSSIKITHCGKNLFDAYTLSGSNVTITDGVMSGKTQHFDAATRSPGNYPILPGVALDHMALGGIWQISENSKTVVGPTVTARFTDNTSSRLIGVPLNTLTPTYLYGVMESGNIAYRGYGLAPIVISYSDGYNLTETISQFQIEYGDEATAFEAYNGDTYTVTLPITVYGGTYDLITGELVSTYDSTGELLAEPVTQQLTPQPINALEGINNVYCPQGLMSVTYYTHR